MLYIVAMYSVICDILTRFHAFYLGESCIRRNSMSYLTWSSFRVLHICTRKAEAGDFAALAFPENAGLQ